MVKQLCFVEIIANNIIGKTVTIIIDISSEYM